MRRRRPPVDAGKNSYQCQGILGSRLIHALRSASSWSARLWIFFCLVFCSQKAIQWQFIKLSDWAFFFYCKRLNPYTSCYQWDHNLYSFTSPSVYSMSRCYFACFYVAEKIKHVLSTAEGKRNIFRFLLESREFNCIMFCRAVLPSRHNAWAQLFRQERIQLICSLVALAVLRLVSWTERFLIDHRAGWARSHRDSASNRCDDRAYQWKIVREVQLETKKRVGK